jgi:GNAT superfamily N-acetyltransferase
MDDRLNYDTRETRKRRVVTMVEDTSATAVVEALEANMAAFWAGYGRAPGAELHEGDDLLRVVTGISEPLFNGVFRASLSPDAVDGAIAETLARVASRRVPMFWWVGPSTRPTDLDAHLERHGFAHAGSSPAMAMDLRTLPENPPEIPGLAIEPVGGLEELRSWARAAALGTGFPEPFSDELAELEVGAGLGPRGGPYTRYVAYQDGEAVGTSALLLHSGVAGIFAVATLPRARGQGIGTALTVAPLLEARRRGYRVGTLQATQMGFPIYGRLGFREVCPPIELYLWSP